jgi:hypothetical protein
LSLLPHRDGPETCREYLPEQLEMDRSSLDALATGQVPPALADLVRRRVVLDLPKKYY